MSPQEELIPQAALRARSFGAVVDDYEQVRPGYPTELFDDLLAYAGPVDRVLEVGAGTGRATVVLASRGLAVHAVEHDPAMAAVLAGRVAAWPEVSVTVAGFEDEPVDGGYDLLVSAQAWHWVDPHLRWRRAAACLRAGGSLALFWNRDRVLDDGQRARLQAVHDHWTPGIRLDDEPEVGDLLAEWPGPALLSLEEFTDVTARDYRWERSLSAEDYVRLLSTLSAYAVRPADARAALFAELLEVAGDEVVLTMDTALYLARRV